MTNSHRSKIDYTIVHSGPTLSIEQLKLAFLLQTKRSKTPSFPSPMLTLETLMVTQVSFFKACWSSIGSLVCDDVHEFLDTCVTPKVFSATNLVILPKVRNSQHATMFRPISCWTIIDKCITKLICSRIKEVLPHSILENQGDFVKTKELLSNVLIC